LVEVVFALVGLGVGVLIGLTGIGGGSLMTPALIFLGIPPIHAVGTDLAFNTITKSFGSAMHIRRGNIDRRVIFFLMIGSIPAMFLGMSFLSVARASLGWQSINRFVAITISFVLIAVSTFHFFRLKEHREPSRNDPPLMRRSDALAVGFLIGLIVQITSIGSGSLLMPYLMKVLNSPRRMVGTDLLYGLIITAFAASTQFAVGNVQLYILAYLLVGSIPGIILGVRLSDRISTRPLRAILSLLILTSGILLLYRILATGLKG
jgi:uncharacterized membrane protein YfcA